MPENLTEKKCVPCEGGVPSLTKLQAEKLLRYISGWDLNDSTKQISRQIKAKNFIEAIKLINKIADIAESENHHPDLHLTGYKNLRIDLSTHAIKGLSENDFIVAAKINQLIAG
jgi:4a-hydroxytetrahydrobiopterin dehydratase